MAQKAYWPNSKGLKKTIQTNEIYLGLSWDIKHGVGWFCQVHRLDWSIGFGFHKTNKFTAVREALKI